MKFLSFLAKKDLQNKICLLRVDFNIQKTDLSKNHLRISAILPTINFLLKNKAKVVILSHRGRPIKSKISRLTITGTQKSQKYSLKPFVKILSSLLKKSVYFIDFKKEFNVSEIKKIINSPAGDIFLLENLRFFEGEEKNDKKFAKRLASLGDFYVNDAFSDSHRNNASITAITEFLPSYAGFSFKNEIENLDKAIKNFKKPLVVILAGAKISDKIGLIKNFLSRADYFLIGGGMANTFAAAQGLPVGDSLYENKMFFLARQFLKSKKIILPIDTIVYKRQILDIGSRTIEQYSKIIKNAKTIIWNGPMGYIEDKRFRKGSEAIAGAILKSKAFSVIGGGETTSLLKPKTYNLKPNLFMSTGGGAMLEYLAGKKLPGLEALN